MPISKTRFPEKAGKAEQINRPSDNDGKAINKFNGRENLGAGKYELQAKRDFEERIYRYWHRA